MKRHTCYISVLLYGHAFRLPRTFLPSILYVLINLSKANIHRLQSYIVLIWTCKAEIVRRKLQHNVPNYVLTPGLNVLSSTHFRVKCNKKMVKIVLWRSTASYLKMVNGKCVDKEPNTPVVSFLEMSSTSSETAMVDKNAIHISCCTRNKDCMLQDMVHPKLFPCSASF